MTPPRTLPAWPALAGAALAAVLGVPLLWSLWAAVAAGTDARAWSALAHDPQTAPALALSLCSALLASLLSVAAAAHLLAGSFGHRAWPRLVRLLGPLLAVPHAAFAIGLALLIAPSGWLVRALSPWATGWDAPPPWPTTQDPWGLGLIAVLVCKEIPFVLWAAMAQLQRPDVAQRLQQELQLAATLGYSTRAAWWRVAWPQLWPRLGGPLLAVLAYSLTVVDVALLIGPGTPPPLAVLAWQWLQDADPARNAQGVAAAWLLCAVLAVCAGVLWVLATLPLWRRRRVRGVAPYHPALADTRPRTNARGGGTGAGLAGGTDRRPPIGYRTFLQALRPVQARRHPPWTMLLAVYAAVGLALLLGSAMDLWPFPALWPAHWSLAAWQAVADSSRTLFTTTWLALGSALAALAWALAWLELAPPRWPPPVRALLVLPLVLPAVLWVVGLHRVALAWGWDAQAGGLWLAHTLACVPYVLMALQGPYTRFDARLGAVAASLGHGRWVFLLRIKWPLLRAPLAAAFAVGFAVSVAQYLPTLYVGAGRFATVGTEAVNLAASGQRALTSAYAALQWVLPLLVFALAARLGRARRF